MNFKVLSLLLCLVSSTTFAKLPVRVAISSAPSNLSPFFSTDANSQNINRMVHTSLIDFNEKMEVICRLCTDYKEKHLGETYSITFNLKKKQKFWDETLITAEDIKKSWKYFTEDKEIKSIFRFAFSKIKNVIIHSPSKVEIVYDKFALDALPNLTLLKILKLKNKKGKPELKDIIGGGDYKYGKISPLEVQINPVDKTGFSYLFKVVKDETTLVLKIMNKEVDLSVAEISPRKTLWLKRKAKENGFSILERSGTNYKYIGLNHKSEFLGDVNVRKALSHLIPREGLLKNKLKGTAEIAKSMFSSSFSNVFIDFPVDKYDVKKAKELFAKAGIKPGKGRKLFKGKKQFKLSWKVSNNKSTIELVNTIKSYLEKAGIEVNVVVQEWGTFMKDVKKGEFDIFVGQWVGFTGPDMMNYVFHSKSIPPKGANRGHYINTEFDSLLDKAALEMNINKRNNYFKDALKITQKTYPYINLWHPKIMWVARNCLKKIKLSPTGSFYPLLNLENSCGK